MRAGAALGKIHGVRSPAPFREIHAVSSSSAFSHPRQGFCQILCSLFKGRMSISRHHGIQFLEIFGIFDVWIASVQPMQGVFDILVVAFRGWSFWVTVSRVGTVAPSRCFGHHRCVKLGFVSTQEFQQSSVLSLSQILWSSFGEAGERLFWVAGTWIPDYFVIYSSRGGEPHSRGEHETKPRKRSQFRPAKSVVSEQDVIFEGGSKSMCAFFIPDQGKKVFFPVAFTMFVIAEWIAWCPITVFAPS